MRLKSIKLSGFKSFVDPTPLVFQTNLTGIVGPNGCGKSNIVDAARWVVGESSAKQLRGESMTDVIFNGTTGRKPVGQASVEMVFDNAEGRIEGEYAAYNEISLRREVTRDGQSSYYLNGTRCRRKDITDLLLGTGLGPRSYSVIEQGMISRLIEAKPEDMRVHLEEVAGISKYKERRRETERRIQHTRDNLDRLNDLREELEKQLIKLKRQSEAAEKFKEYKAEQRILKGQLLTLQWNAVNEQITAQDRLITEEENAVEGQTGEQRRIDTAIEKHRVEETELRDAFNEVQARYYSFGEDIARLEQRIQHARERTQQLENDLQQLLATREELDQQMVEDDAQVAELCTEIENIAPNMQAVTGKNDAAQERLAAAEQAMAEWQNTWDEFNTHAAKVAQKVEVEQTRVQHLQQQIERTQERIDKRQVAREELDYQSLPAKISELSTQEDQLKSTQNELHLALTSLREQVNYQREQAQQGAESLDEAKDVLQDVRARQTSLQALQQAALGKTDDETLEWLKSQTLNEKPRLIEGINVDSGWEQAVETVLSGYLNAICVDNLQEKTQALCELTKGDVTLFDLSDTHDSHTTVVSTPTLATKITSKWPVSGLLKHVYIADTVDEAQQLCKRVGAHESVITKEGVWVGRGWSRVARATEKTDSVVVREQELRDLDGAVTEQMTIVSEKQQALQQTKENIQELEQQLDSKQQQQRELSEKFNAVHRELTAMQARLEQLQEREAAILQEMEEHRLHISSTEEELQSTAESHAQAAEQMATQQRRKTELLEQRQETEKELQVARETAREAKQALDELQVRHESNKSQLHFLEQGKERAQKQLSQVDVREQALKESITETNAPVDELKEELQRALEKRSVVESELTEAKQKVQAVEHALRELEQQRHRVEELIQQLNKKLEKLRMDWQGMQVNRENYTVQLQEAEFDVEEILSTMPGDAQLAVWQERITQLENRITRLGPINLAAIDELDQLDERKTYLDRQNADLIEALETLENAIQKIDKETKDKFRETFNIVNEGFQLLFPKIFGGGAASLELTDDDLLSTGIVVRAQPPGKRNTTIHLLSGGEKALTAIALVFSLFQLNPAPFCILDEVDAPLDDANVGRYCNLVKEMSDKVQFIFISHNKVAIEMASQLAGVTMQEPGVSRLVSVDIDQAVAMAEA